MAYPTSNKYKEWIYDEDSIQNIDIIIDEKIIDKDFVRSLKYKDTVFENNFFSLGSASISQYTLEVDNAVFEEIQSDFSEVTFYFHLEYENNTEEVIPLGTYRVVKKDDKSSDYTVYTLYDYLSKFDGTFDASGIVPCTRYELLQAMCKYFEVELENESFINCDVLVNTYDSTISGLTYLSLISERAGGFAKINKATNKLVIKSFGDVDKYNLPIEVLGDYTTNEKKTISKVIYENAIQKFVAGDDTGETIFLAQDSLFSCSQEEVDNIYNSLSGLSFQSLDVRVWGDPSIDTGDIISFADVQSFAQMDWTWGNGFYGNYKTTLEKSTQTSKVKKISASKQMRKLQAEIDELSGIIKLTNEKVETTQKNVDDLEESVNLFNAYLSQENLIVSTDSTKKPLETKTYEIVVESYFKGELVSPSVSIDGNNEGITAKVETGKIVIVVDSSTVITNTNNDYSVEISFMDGNKKYTSNKKLTVSLALSGAPGKDGAKGDKGDDGTPGKDGENGKDGVSNYTHIRYSQNANGDGMTTEATGAIYIGIAITTSATAPTSPSSYFWSKIKGDDGERGIDGIPGKDGTSSYLHIRWSEDGKTFSKPNLNNKKLVSGFITTAGAFEEKSSTYPNSKYFEPFILKNGDTISIELPSSKDFRLRLFETDDRWITTVSLNGKEVSYKNSRGRDVKVYILFYSGISQEDADQVIFYKQSEIGKQPARYQGTYVDTNPTDSENFDDYNWVDTAIVVNEVIEEVKTNVADLEIGLDHVTTTVSESIETTNDIENRLTAVEQTASGLDIKVSENQQKLDNLNGTNNRLKNLEDSNSKLNLDLETMQGTIEMMNFNFRTDGLHIGSDGVDVNSKLDNQGLRIYNVSTLISIFNKNGSGFEKLIVTESIQFQNLKLLARTIDTPTKSGRKVVSCFWVDELIETLEDLED